MDNLQDKDWSNNLFAGVVYFALGNENTGIEYVEKNTDFEYETAISSVVLGKRKLWRP